MNLAVIGSGGREHAICYKLKHSAEIKKLICIPGNAGTEKIAKNINTNISDFDSWLAKQIPPEKRSLWLMRLRRGD